MRIAVLLSGGVDSSVALRRVLAEGHRDVKAYYLKIWLEDEVAYLGACPWEEDLAYAQAVCDQAGVELEVVSLQSAYFDRVVAYALEELRAGRTPSPDLFCNQRVKFAAFFDAVQGEFDKVATGHYAQVRESEGRFSLWRAPDPVKDQTYFLSYLSQEQLAKIMFPIGDLTKPAVRALAQDYDLANKERRDSQGICFLGKIPYNQFVSHYLGTREGPLVEAVTGRTLGTHQGFWFHTIGQRTGLGLGNGPWYVSAKDSNRNIVYVSHAQDNPVRERTGFGLAELNWLAGFGPSTADLTTWNDQGLSCKLRHGPNVIPCRLEGPPDQLMVTLARPDPGIAAGQFAVFYRGEECLGAGKIAEPDPELLAELFDRYQAQPVLTKPAPKKTRRNPGPTAPAYVKALKTNA